MTNVKQKLVNVYNKYNLIKFLYNTLRYFDIHVFFNRFRFCKFIKIKKKYARLYALKGSLLKFAKNTSIELADDFIINSNKIGNSKAESKIQLFSNSKIFVSGKMLIWHNANIVVKDEGQLIFHGGFINSYCDIFCANKIEIGENCLIGRNVRILDTDLHCIYDKNNELINPNKPIFIDKNVWICSGATILKGVTIGEGAIIAAGAIVASNVPPHSIVAGNPARVIKENIRWDICAPDSDIVLDINCL